MSGNIYPGDLQLGGLIPGFICGLIAGGGGFYPGDLKSTLTIL